MSRITVTVPATTANLGPGFDCLGLALGLYNQITFETRSAGLEIDVAGEGAAVIPRDHSNLVIQAANRLFEYAGQRPSGLCVRQQNNIPVGSGLGSSAATVIGGLLAANALVNGRLDNDTLLKLATELEGHPDNVAPALLGGLVLVNQEDGDLWLEPLEIPDMRVVIVLPDFDLPTAVARAALPQQVPLADAIFNASRLALLVHALAAGDFRKIGLAMQDRLHQPFRLPLIPGMAEAFRAAQTAGAAAVALSGAGPSVIAFAPDKHEQIGDAITSAFAVAGLSSRTWLLPINRQGSTLVRQ